VQESYMMGQTANGQATVLNSDGSPMLSTF